MARLAACALVAACTLVAHGADARAQRSPPAPQPAASQPAASQPAASQPAASQPASKPTPSKPAPLVIDHNESDRAVPAGEPVQISARIRSGRGGGLTGVSARLFFRAAGEKKYQLSGMQRLAAMRFAGRVPPFAVVPPALEYYIEAEAAGARALRGSPSSPLRLPVAGEEVAGPPGKPPWYKRWYVWVSIGIVVAGVTAAVIVAVNQPDADVPVPQP